MNGRYTVVPAYGGAGLGYYAPYQGRYGISGLGVDSSATGTTASWLDFGSTIIGGIIGSRQSEIDADAREKELKLTRDIENLRYQQSIAADRPGISPMQIAGGIAVVGLTGYLIFSMTRRRKKGRR